MKQLDWDAVDAFATRNGVKYVTRRGWRHQGIPHKYRLDLIASTAGAVSREQIEAHDRKLKRGREKKGD